MKKLLYVILLIASIVAVFPTANVVKAQAAQQPPVTLDPLTFNATQLSQTVTFNIDISNVQNLWGWTVNVTYDSAYLKFQSGADGSFLTSQGATDLYVATKPQNFQDQYSNIYTKQVVTLQSAIDTSSNGEDQSVSGSGTLATVTFQVVNQTTSTPVVLGVQQLLGPTATSAEPGTNPTITPASATSTALVSLIIPGPPTANAGKEQSVPSGTQVTLDGSQSVSTGSNTTYTWTFTDASKQQTLNGIIANYTFNNAGNYTVTLTVNDSLGTSTSTVIIHVIPTSATATPAASTTPPPTNTSSTTTTSTPTATATATASPQPTGNSSLPPTIVGVLIFVTICALAGAFFWLRKQT
ncbi:MAG: PKD domain-containing protein [Candidatus Bathyarchaeia archaeon]